MLCFGVYWSQWMKVEIDDPVNAVLGKVSLCDVPCSQQIIVCSRRRSSRRVVLEDLGRQRLRRRHGVVLEVARQREQNREDGDADDVASDLLTLAGQRGAVRTT